MTGDQEINERALKGLYAVALSDVLDSLVTGIRWWRRESGRSMSLWYWRRTAL